MYLVEAEEDEQRNVDQCGVSPLVEREAAVRVGVEFGDHVFEDLRGRHNNASHTQTRMSVSTNINMMNVENPFSNNPSINRLLICV